MERQVNIDGKKVGMRASALIPRIYRFKFGRDIVADMNELKKKYDKAMRLGKDATEEEKRDAQLSALDLTIFEDLAWTMIKEYAKCHGEADAIPDSPDEWLDSIEGIFSVYEIMPTILELWGASQQTTVTPAKK